MKVKVSPHYRGNGWYDSKSQITFSVDKGEITVPEGVDRTNINRYIRLNYLTVLEERKKPQSEEEMKNISIKTPGQLLAEDEPVKADEPTVEVEEVEETEETVEVEVVEEEPEEEEVPEDNTCQYCGRKLKTASGKASHEKACKKNPENK